MKNQYEIRGDSVAITLKRKDGNELEAIIDTNMLPKVLEYTGTWYASYNPKTKSFYVKGNIPKKPTGQTTIPLHRYLLSEKLNSKLVVDHINHDTLDNRLGNLRIATAEENQQNRMKARKNSSTGIRCVLWRKTDSRYVVLVQSKGTRHYIGAYEDIHDAEIASIEARKRYQGYSFDLHGI